MRINGVQALQTLELITNVVECEAPAGALYWHIDSPLCIAAFLCPHQHCQNISISLTFFN